MTPSLPPPSLENVMKRKKHRIVFSRYVTMQIKDGLAVNICI